MPETETLPLPKDPAAETPGTAPLSVGQVPGDTPPPLAPQDAVPRKRGRPPGSGDKRPRVRKAAPSGAPKGPKIAVNPLSQPLEGEPDVPAASDAPKTAPRKTRAQDLVTLSSAELAALAVGLGSAIVVKAGAKRYGENAMILALDAAEKEQIEGLTAKCLDKYLVKMEPEYALAIMLVVIYGQKVAIAEMAKSTGVDASAIKQAAEQQMGAAIDKARAA